MSIVFGRLSRSTYLANLTIQTLHHGDVEFKEKAVCHSEFGSGRVCGGNVTPWGQLILQ
jgi:hypothetical protein